MREIKFRGKTESGKWVYGSLCMSAVHEPNICWCDGDVVIGTPIIRQDTIGQNVGLKDGKGKEVYEGDIVCTYVTYTNEDEEVFEFWRVGEVCYVNGGFALTNCTNYDNQILTTKSDVQPSKKTRHSFPAYRSEIIGNIYDNPELLKGGAQ